ncbi:a-factor receptor [Orbilia blumenaviensis]|uniref:A-factor receptor n=1 Tax=Orbilia blumenaviensis TaxID=1796055 RepID=A0AAV9UJA6_9PEZI
MPRLLVLTLPHLLNTACELFESHLFHITVIIFTIIIEFLIALRDSHKAEVLSPFIPDLSTQLSIIMTSSNTYLADEKMTSERGYFVFCSFTAILSLVVPFIWQIRRENVAAALLCFWLQTDLLFCLIDAIIWPTWNSVATGWQGRGYCDLVAKWKLAAEFGAVNSAVMCIMLTICRLFWGLSMYRETRKMKRLRMIYEWGLVGLFPILLAGLHYVVQPSRYYLTPVHGCHPSIDNSWASLIVLGWPLLFSTAALVFTFIAFYKINKHLDERSIISIFRSDSSLDTSFQRLYLLGALFTLIYYPTNIYGFIQFCLSSMLPYDWDAVHGDWWDRIYKFPDNPHFQYQRWIKIVASWILGIIFGFGPEAQKIYWDICCLFHIEKEVQKCVWAYKRFKQNARTNWIPKITPKWYAEWRDKRRKARESLQLQQGQLALGGHPSRPVKRGFISTCIRWYRQMILRKKKRGDIRLEPSRDPRDHEYSTNIASLGECGGTDFSKRRAGAVAVQRASFGSNVRNLVNLVGYPRISISWMRNPITRYNRAPELALYRIPTLKSYTNFIDTFDATSLEAIAQQAALQAASEIELHCNNRRCSTSESLTIVAPSAICCGCCGGKHKPNSTYGSSSQVTTVAPPRTKLKPYVAEPPRRPIGDVIRGAKEMRKAQDDEILRKLREDPLGEKAEEEERLRKLREDPLGEKAEEEERLRREKEGTPKEEPVPLEPPKTKKWWGWR